MFIVLAHEMIHAEYNARGVRFMSRYVQYEFQYKGNTVTKKEDINDLAAIGIKGNRVGDITENMIRSEHKLRLRGAYEL